MSQHLTWKIYQELIQEARHLANINATAQFSTVRSRGWWLSACDNDNETLTENAELNNSRSYTLQSFLEEHYKLTESGAASISISGGFDGADSLYGLNNGDYTPWVSEWSFEIWNSTDGWIRNPVHYNGFSFIPFECMENN